MNLSFSRFSGEERAQCYLDGSTHTHHLSAFSVFLTLSVYIHIYIFLGTLLCMLDESVWFYYILWCAIHSLLKTDAMCLCPDMLSQENTVSTPTLNSHSSQPTILSFSLIYHWCKKLEAPPKKFTAAAFFVVQFSDFRIVFSHLQKSAWKKNKNLNISESIYFIITSLSVSLCKKLIHARRFLPASASPRGFWMQSSVVC